MKITDLEIVVFESPLRDNFQPLSLTRPTFDLLLGCCSLLERIQRTLGVKATQVAVPDYLKETVRESHPELKVNVTAGKSLTINALVSSTFDLGREVQKIISANEPMIVLDSETSLPVLALLDEYLPASKHSLGMTNTNTRQSKRFEMPQKKRSVDSALLRYSWQLFQENGGAISKDFATNSLSLPRVSSRVNDRKYEQMGNRVMISDSAEIESYVSIDSRAGPVIVDDGAQIQSFSYLTGPCYVGKNCVIKSARIRNNTSIGAVCKVAGEIEESIFLEYTNKNHDGFIGHSLIGGWINLGALTTSSDLKNTYGKISVNIQGKKVPTDSAKIGIVMGDMSKTAVGTMIYSGKKIGVASHIFGTVTEDVPSFSLFSGLGNTANKKEIYVESAIETQRRMMQRRSLQLSEAQATLIRKIYALTSKERYSSGVRKGKFQLS